jgi:hypothetical protein
MGAIGATGLAVPRAVAARDPFKMSHHDFSRPLYSRRLFAVKQSPKARIDALEVEFGFV